MSLGLQVQIQGRSEKFVLQPKVPHLVIIVRWNFN